MESLTDVYSYYSLASLPPQFMTLDPRLSMALKQLPAKITKGSDQSKYNTIVRYWGSHFVMSANFGGKINLDTFISNSYVHSKSQSFLAQQFSLNFHYQMFDLSSGGYHNKSDIKLDESFKHAATTKSGEGVDVVEDVVERMTDIGCALDPVYRENHKRTNAEMLKMQVDATDKRRRKAE